MSRGLERHKEPIYFNLKNTMNALFEDDVLRCLDVLKRGGLILYPTDTVWGIGCDATNEAAVKKVYELKQRDDSKSLIVLLGDERDVLQYTASPDLSVFDYLKQQDRPTTVIFNDAIGLPPNLVASDGSIAIRLVQDEFCRHLIRRFRKPVVSTSANISGQPAASHFATISPDIRNGVEYVVEWRRDDESPAQQSRIVRWNRDGSVTVIRS